MASDPVEESQSGRLRTLGSWTPNRGREPASTLPLDVVNRILRRWALKGELRQRGPKLLGNRGRGALVWIVETCG